MQQERIKRKLRQLNIAVLGPEGHGKTSITNWLVGQMDSKGEQYTLDGHHHYIQYLRHHINIFDYPGSKSQQPHQLIPQLVGIQHVLFVVSAKDLHFEDSQASIKSMLQVFAMCDIKRIVFAITQMDGTNLINISMNIAIPSVNWNKNRYLNIKEQLEILAHSIINYKKEPIEISFAPVSGLLGENIHRNNEALVKNIHWGICHWFLLDTVPSLLEQIEKLFILKGKTMSFRESKELLRKKPLRVSVVGKILNLEEEFEEVSKYNANFQQQNHIVRITEDIKGLFVYVHSGKLRRNTILCFQPSETFAIVQKIVYCTEQQMKNYQGVKMKFMEQVQLAKLEKFNTEPEEPTHASPGSFCFVYFHNKERLQIPLYAIGGIPQFNKMPLLVKYFSGRLKIINPNQVVKRKTPLWAIAGTNKFRLSISEVMYVNDKKMGKTNLLESQHNLANGNQCLKLKADEVYSVRFTIDEATICENYQKIPSLGKLYIFEQGPYMRASNNCYYEVGQFCGVALVEDLTYLHNSLDYLPRAFAIPQAQVTDAITKEKREDWNTCQIDMTEPISCITVPCGHIRMCTFCAQRIYHCPFCKTQVLQRLRMQVMSLEDDIQLMKFALCDYCSKSRFTHTVRGCEQLKFLCDECIDPTQKCKLCGQTDHYYQKIYV